MYELFAMAVWALIPLRKAARTVFLTYFEEQTFQLRPVMRKIRKGLLPAALLAVGFAPFTQAHGMPGQLIGGGTNVVERSGAVAELRDGVSLDELWQIVEGSRAAAIISKARMGRQRAGFKSRVLARARPSQREGRLVRGFVASGFVPIGRRRQDLGRGCRVQSESYA